MEMIARAAEVRVTQLGFFESVAGLLRAGGMALAGGLIILVILAVMFKIHPELPRMKTGALSLLLYYYASLMFTNIVGIPTLSEWNRMLGLNEGLFHPNINLIPFVDGISISFILNIVLFLPLGFLCPVISRRYRDIRMMLLMGAGLSLVIELTQMFTLYRASDIDDLLANTAGAVLGYGIFWLMLGRKKKTSNLKSKKGTDKTAFLPVIIVGCAFLAGFFS